MKFLKIAKPVAERVEEANEGRRQPVGWDPGQGSAGTEPVPRNSRDSSLDKRYIVK